MIAIYNPGPRGGSNLKAYWRSLLTSVRRPISYRIFSLCIDQFSFFPSSASSPAKVEAEITLMSNNTPHPPTQVSSKLPTEPNFNCTLLPFTTISYHLLRLATTCFDLLPFGITCYILQLFSTASHDLLPIAITCYHH